MPRFKVLAFKAIPFMLIALASSAFAANIWYVEGVHGSDNNDCKSPQSACKTIGHAISLASSGDSIMVAAATYKENLTIAFSLKVIGATASTTPHLWDEEDSMGDAINRGIEPVLSAMACLRQLSVVSEAGRVESR